MTDTKLYYRGVSFMVVVFWEIILGEIKSLKHELTQNQVEELPK